MAEKDLEQCREQTEPTIDEEKEIDNIKRILTMLEKALDRILRRNYYNRSQYPQMAFEIEEQMNILREWIQDYELYCALPGFRLQVGLALKDLEDKISQLKAVCRPSAGKKRIKKNFRFKSTLSFANQLIPCWII